MHRALAVVLASVQKSCEKGNHAEIAKLLQENRAIRQSITIFSLPSFPNCGDCVQIAASNLADNQINCPGSLERNALIASIILGVDNLPVIRTLVTYGGGSLVNVTDAFGRTAVHYAVIRDDLDILRLVVEAGAANLKQQDSDGNTLLHQYFLFHCSNVKMLEYLLSDGPGNSRELLPLANLSGVTAQQLMDQSTSVEHLMSLRILHSPKKRYSAEEVVILRPEKIEIPDLERLSTILGRYPAARDTDGNTLLHHLAKHGASTEVLQYCFSYQEVVKMVNAKNNDAMTPLHLAVIHEVEEMVNALVTVNLLDQRICDKSGALPINYAIYNSRIFMKLFNLDPDIIFAVDGNGMSPFCLLLVTDSLDEADTTPLQILKEICNCAPLNGKDKLRRSIFHYFAMFCQSERLRGLILNDLRPFLHSQLNERDCDGRVPTAYALLHRNEFMFNLIMIHFSPNLTIIDVAGRNCLHLALSLPDLNRDWIKWILHHQPSLAHAPCSDDRADPYPVFAVIRLQDLDLLKLLIEVYKVDVKLKTEDLNSIWHYIALYRVQDSEIISWLLNHEEARKIIHDKNIYKQTAQAIAKARGNMTLLEQLTLNELALEEEDEEQVEIEDEKPEIETSEVVSENLKTPSQVRESWEAIGSGDECWKRLKTALTDGYMGQIMFAVNDLETCCLTLYDDGGNTPLHLLCYLKTLTPAIADFFLLQTRKIKSLVNCQNRFGEAPIHVAARQQNLTMLMALLVHSGINLGLRNLRGETFLVAAINNSRSEVETNICLYKTVFYALNDQKRQDLVTIPDYSGQSPLLCAIHRDLFDVVKLLIEDVNAPVDYINEPDGNTLLHQLADYTRQDARIVRYLTEHSRANKHLNKPNNSGETPLHRAAKANNVRFVRHLLEQKSINLRRVDQFRNTPLLAALSKNYRDTDVEVVRALLNKAPHMAVAVNVIGLTSLLFALRLGRLDILERIIEAGRIDVKGWRDQQGNTLLHYLALYSINSVEICQYLIKRGEKSINAANSLGDTPLHYLCYYGYDDLIEIFLESEHIDPSLLDSKQNSPLNLYLEKPNHTPELAVIELLLRKTPNCIVIKNSEGTFPLLKAIKSYTAPTSRWLLQTMLKYGNIDFDIVDDNGSNIFHHLAAHVNNEPLIRAFVAVYMNQSTANIGSIMQAANLDQKTPIDVARTHKNEAFLDVVEMT